MRIIKDRIQSDVSKYEIICTAFERRRKLLVAGSYREPVLVFKYPYMKLYKKIIHRVKIPLTEQDILHITDESKILTDKDGFRYKKGHILTADHLMFINSGKSLLIAYRNGDVLVYNTQTWKKQWEHKFSGKIGSIQKIRNKKDLFISTEDWNLYEISISDFKIKNKKTLKEKNKGIAIATDNLDKIFVILDKKRIASFTYDNLEELKVFKGHNRGINKIALTPDEKYLISSGMDCNLCVYNSESGELLSHLIGHSDEVHQFILSNDNKFVLSSSEDETLKLWNLATYKCVHTINNVPNALAMGRYKNLIVMGNVSGELRIFRII